jgi:hypothetical protein
LAAPGVTTSNTAMSLPLLDVLMLLGAVLAALAVAAACVVGLVVWLAGGDRGAE